MPTTDFRVQCGFFNHPKTVLLRRLLGGDGVCSLLQLIEFCSMTRGKSSGNLCGMNELRIEVAAGWVGDHRALLPALVEVGYLDEVDDCPICGGGCLWLHDFTEHNPWVAGADRRSEAARKAAQKRWGRRESDDECEAHAPRMRSASKNHAPRIKNDADRNAPSPSPSPSPSPNPNPDPELFSEQEIEPKGATEIQQVWEAYREHHRRIALTLGSHRKEYRQIRCRLEDFTLEQLLECIKGYEGDHWYSVNSNSLEYYMRNAANVEKGIELFHKPRRPPKNNDKPDHSLGLSWDLDMDNDDGKQSRARA